MKNKLFERNIGFVTEWQQEKISKLSISIAGAGGDGGLLAERLARFGVGTIILADPEFFEVQNINRQFGSNSETLGKNKAEVVAQELRKINPDIKVVVFNQGITEENVKEFVNYSDIIIDEIEYSVPEISVMLAKEARIQNKFVFMGANIGWGSSTLCFDPSGMTFEEYFEYNENDSSIDAMKYMPEVPAYISNEMLEKVLGGEMSMPSISSSVALVAAMVSSQVISFVIRNEKPVTVPNILFFDTYDFTIKKGGL